MKKIFVVLSVLSLLSISCKENTSSKETKEPIETTEVVETYQVTSEGSEVYWTGYKFTEKTGVKGKFKTIDVKNAPEAESQLAAFNGVAFSIPTSSIFSENEIRDNKLVTLFFNIMDQTELLTGTFTVKGEKLFLNLKMNGTTKEIALTHTITDRKVKIEGTLNILDFGAEDAYNSIHKACEVLHTGEDGVSKTWEEVAIEASVSLQ